MNRGTSSTNRSGLRNLIIVFLATTILVPFFASALQQAVVNINFSGAIGSPMTAILRHFDINWVPHSNSQNINSFIDGFVSSHPQINAIMLTELRQFGIWWYGYSFSPTRGTWTDYTFDQLKTVIDRFHYHGWLVGLDSTSLAWAYQTEYYYIQQQHRELAFVDANGKRADDIDKIASDNGFGAFGIDYFSKFETPDTANNIVVGTRLLDLYCTRLGQMIRDGLTFDFWYGSEGWLGLSMQQYYWKNPNPSLTYSFSYQEIAEWSAWTQMILPSGWGSLTNVEQASWIRANAPDDWWDYWQDRFAQMYAQIRQVFIDAGRPGPFYTIGTLDLSAEWDATGALCAVGMYNISKLAQHNSFDYYYADQEAVPYENETYLIGKQQTYVGALGKSKDPRINVIIGLQPVDWLGNKRPEWEVKMSYLAQAENYVWFNGSRYRVADPKIVMLQYPTSYGYEGWTETESEDLWNWIAMMAAVLKDATPLWLGPTVPIPNVSAGGVTRPRESLNFVIDQWFDARNVQNHPEYISKDMGTIILDETTFIPFPPVPELYDRIVSQLWGSGNLSLWYWKALGGSWRLSRIFGNHGEQAEFALKLKYNPSSSTSYTILSGISDPYANWIASGYEGTAYSVLPNGANPDDYRGIYSGLPGLISIANFTAPSPNTVGLSIYYSSNTSRFLYTHIASGVGADVIVPRDLLNKALYWVSNSPINSSQPLMDLKVFRLSDGTILIPMLNMKDAGDVMGTSDGWPLSSSLQLDAAKLGLNSEQEYSVYWQSTGANVPVSNWNSVQITLRGMADILVIKQRL